MVEQYTWDKITWAMQLQQKMILRVYGALGVGVERRHVS
jgi:hypothetical protein